MEQHDRDPVAGGMSSRGRRRAVAALVLAAAVSLAGCSGTGNGAPSTAGPTDQASESPPAELTTRFQSRCFYEDGQLVGDYSSLEETWASTNYLRIDHCVTRYVGPPPFTLTEEEKAVVEIASSQLVDAGEPEQLFLDVYAACTRIGSEDGPYGFSSIPVPILEATLALCPEAPQADIIRERVSV